MTHRRQSIALALALAASGHLFAVRPAPGQAVGVTARLDQALVPAGGSTTLRVMAQVVPEQRPNAAGILSWYVDVLNSRPAIASADFGAMTRPASDRDPLLSSAGVASGGNRLGMYDTFLNRPGAGVSNPVALLHIPIRAGTTSGAVRFVVKAGTGVPELSGDFLVEPLGPGPALAGGDYTLALADLVVCDPRFRVERSSPPTGVLIRFDPCPSADMIVEASPRLDGVSWQPLAGAPHNSGTVAVTNAGGNRFFRLRVAPR